jgi:hypothetical protein
MDLFPIPTGKMVFPKSKSGGNLTEKKKKRTKDTLHTAHA